MKIKFAGHGYAHHKYEVSELTLEEMGWSDRRIITMCDRKGQLTDEQWAEIEGGRHPGHFGGHVTRFAGDAEKLHVKVYID